MKALGHRERVMRTIDQQDVDRVPMLFRTEPEPLEAICRHFNLTDEWDVLRFFDVDVVTRLPIYKLNHEKNFPDLASMETPEDVYNVPWQGPEVLDLDACEADLKHAHETGLAVTGGIWASIFTLPRRITGEEKFLINMAMNPDLTHAMIDRTTDMFLDMNRVLLDRCAKYIDIYYFGTDLGAQRGLFISPVMIEQYIMPNFRRIVDQAHSYELKVMFHSCGAVSEIIPMFIDTGVDVLDPVQVSAAGMSPKALADAFKGKIAFHGAISTQTTLPFGSPEQVRQEVHDTLDALGPLGIIVGPDQDLIGDNPVRNVAAMYDAARSYHW